LFTVKRDKGIVCVTITQLKSTNTLNV